MSYIFFSTIHQFVLMNNLRDEKALIKLGNHIRKIRKEKNMTMMDLAYESDIEYKQVCRIEKGETNATVSTLLAIAKGLQINISDIISILDSTK